MKLSSMILGTFLLTGSLLASEIKPIKEVFEPKGKFPETKFMKVAVVQWAPEGSAPLGSKEAAESFKESNRKVLENYIREAAANGAKLVVTPEFGTVGYPDIPELPSEDDNFRTRKDVAPYVETDKGTTAKRFSKLAKELKVYIHVGMAEVDTKTKNYHNTVLVFDPAGKLVAKYRKAHLYQQEDNYLVPGDKIATYNSPIGKVGMIICSDVYGSFPMDNYAEAKVDVLALSTSWAQANTGWGYFVDGAKWVNAYFLAANQNYYPDSGVINPDGTVQSHIRQTTGIAYGYIPLKK
ncbi:MAG: hypothetical protein Fur0010_04560 [Bdellovibrio sp.]